MIKETRLHIRHKSLTAGQTKQVTNHLRDRPTDRPSYRVALSLTATATIPQSVADKSATDNNREGVLRYPHTRHQTTYQSCQLPQTAHPIVRALTQPAPSAIQRLSCSFETGQMGAKDRVLEASSFSKSTFHDQTERRRPTRGGGAPSSKTGPLSRMVFFLVAQTERDPDVWLPRRKKTRFVDNGRLNLRPAEVKRAKCILWKRKFSGNSGIRLTVTIYPRLLQIRGVITRPRFNGVQQTRPRYNGVQQSILYRIFRPCIAHDRRQP